MIFPARRASLFLAAFLAAATLPLTAIAQTPQAPRPAEQRKDPGYEFVARVLGATEDAWANLFKAMNRRYEPPKLVLFADTTHGACGRQEASSGPIHCERDGKIYLDLGFFKELADAGAPGDFGRAYVIAHEVGHHVQRLLGILDAVAQGERKADSDTARNRISVRTELQADCLAGVWAGAVRVLWPDVIEPGDIESGMAAAAAVGADRMQKAAFGVVTPDSFTHGTSDQRVRWFRKGFDTTQVQACDTFGVDEP